MRILLPLLLGIGVLVAGLWYFDRQEGSLPAAGGEIPAVPALGQPAHDFELPTLEGGRVRLSELRGRPVVLNFWATWCGPCRAEMPELQAAAERYRDQGLVVLGVDLGEGPELVGAFAREFGVKFPLALDLEGSVIEQYGVMNLPTTYFIDRQGIAQLRFIGGPLTKRMLDERIGRIVN